MARLHGWGGCHYGFGMCSAWGVPVKSRAREIYRSLGRGSMADEMTIEIALDTIRRQTLMDVASRLDDGTLTGAKHPQMADAVRKMVTP